MAEPIEYRNQRGKSKWQPQTYDGERLWSRDLRDSDKPVLFTTKRRARRVARRKEVSDARVEMDETFEEVHGEG